MISDLVYERAKGEEENERLRVTLAHLKEKQSELREQRILDEGAYARTRTQLYLSLVVIATSLVLAAALFYIALSGFAAIAALPVVRWGTGAVLALTLTGSSILLVQNLLRRMHSKSYQMPEQETMHRRLNILQGILLAGAVVSAQGIIATGSMLDATLSTMPFVIATLLLLTALLPLLTGVLAWHLRRNHKAFVRTRALQNIESDLHRTRVALHQDAIYNTHHVHGACLNAWAEFNKARMHATDENDEDYEPSDYPAAISYAAFRAEAMKRLNEAGKLDFDENGKAREVPERDAGLPQDRTSVRRARGKTMKGDSIPSPRDVVIESH